ncbi:MAG: preprotein translocase subunit YajC [Simkaniaceae bacterium]|nr:preprotein translocase subunit YajC [Simkaniaceae bacterium]
MYFLPFVADATQGAAEGKQNITQTIIMVVVALLFFYFILWRPEQKRRKNLEQKRTSLKKGDKVTAMGIVGTITKVNTDTVVISSCDETKIEVLKQAVTDIITPAQEAKATGSAEAESK